MNKDEKLRSEGILYTDQYQLTMAQLYYRMGIHEMPGQFDHFFRHYPDYGSHSAGYCINAGLEWLLDWMRTAQITDENVEYLKSQKSRSGKQLFDNDFLRWLRENGRFDCLTMRSIPEGRVVHANVPMNVVQGPLALAQILETPLLNLLNYQTLIATKAARIREAGRCQLLIEFGMRRAQERGALAGARGALIGGADFTSNVGASELMGLSPKGTHAHSMVQAFMAMGEGELGAFQAYADVYPDDCLLLVDTIDTLNSGIPNAIKVFENLQKKGHKPLGIRLDSGDLAFLAIQAAKMLNSAGFPDAKIVLSNQLDEMVLWQIISQIEAEASNYGVDPNQLISRLIYGVGTKLITSQGDGALDGVYKLVGIRKQNEWTPAIKISENIDKILNPGEKQAWRIYDREHEAVADVLSEQDETLTEENELVLRHPSNAEKKRTLTSADISEVERLYVEVMKEGRLVYDPPGLDEMRNLRNADLDRLNRGVRRLLNPHIYHVSLTEKLYQTKQNLIQKFRARKT